MTVDLRKILKHSKSRSQTFTQATEKIRKCKFFKNSPRNSKKTETESPSPDEYDFFLDTINV